MRKLALRGDFRHIRSRRAEFVCNNRELVFSVDESEKPFLYWNVKLFIAESVGVDFWKEIVLFPVMCLLSRDLFAMEIKNIIINNKDYKIPFDKKDKPTDKEVSKIIQTIDLVSDDSYVKLLHNHDSNFIPYCIDELFESKGIMFERDKLLNMCQNIFDKLPLKDKEKGSHKDVTGKTKSRTRKNVKAV